MKSVGTETWARVLEGLRGKIGAQRFELWFKHTELLECSAERAEIGTPNLFVAEWLEKHFKPLVMEGLREALGEAPAQVRFKTSARLFQEASRQHLAHQAEIVREVGRRADERSEGCNPRADMTLANFVVGRGSRLAHACAQEVVAHTRARYDPLFLHSDCGLGKTHLLSGIWNGIREANDGRHVEYCSAETFTNEFVYAMRSHRLDAFRERYRSAAVLLLDDVNFLNGKAGLQEELLHTFDALHRNHRQIVLASDTHPRQMTSFRRNLVNRFVSGMVVCIEPPDVETRLRILRAKALTLDCRIGDEVLAHVAEHVEGSVRDLEGALTGVVAYARLCNRPPDADMARQALSRFRVETGRAVDMDAVERAVGEVFGVAPAALHGRSRARAVSLPRQVCMSLARRATRLSCAEIAGHFGNKHHSSVLFADKRVRERCAKDPDFGRRVEEAEKRLHPQ